MKLLDQYLQEIEKGLNTTGKISVKTDEVGTVTQVKDGVAILSGLDNVGYGEIIEFESGARGMIIDMLPDRVGTIVLGDYLQIRSGEMAKATGNTLSIGVSDEILGRVVNPLADPIDGGAKLTNTKMYPIEKVAPGVVYRKSVTQPVQTGIKSVDALVPVGRGQRELIIGDRGTGKTTLAIDTILNQKGQDMICIYCAIAQKNSKVATTIETLKTHGAMEYTIVVSTSAADPSPLQFLAPFAGAAIGEFFMEKGMDALIVYDDLSKHAVAYRQMSLLLRRPPGREAYPGDIFYLHSRLLERAAKLSEQLGGGSLTALPIIETQEGDVSAYIPTNVISITDGQIFLETDLFNKGIRPALNVGISVSRVGSSAQTKAMKKVAGKIRLELAQFRELEAFMQFASDLDQDTKTRIESGRRYTELLKQDQHATLPFYKQVVSIFAANAGMFEKVPVPNVRVVERELFEMLERDRAHILENIAKERALSDETVAELTEVIETFKKTRTELFTL